MLERDGLREFADPDVEDPALLAAAELEARGLDAVQGRPVPPWVWGLLAAGAIFVAFHACRGHTQSRSFSAHNVAGTYVWKAAPRATEIEADAGRGIRKLVLHGDGSFTRGTGAGISERGRFSFRWNCIILHDGQDGSERLMRITQDSSGRIWIRPMVFATGAYVLEMPGD